jgi:hypothetical protein
MVHPAETIKHSSTHTRNKLDTERQRRSAEGEVIAHKAVDSEIDEGRRREERLWEMSGG